MRLGRPANARRRSDDGQPWTRGDQRDFESYLADELHALRGEIGRGSNRLTAAFLAVAIIAFLTPVVIQVVLFVIGRPA
jgi:hypothetical protein